MKIHKMHNKENSQIWRLFNLKNENIDVIYISPF